MAQHSRDNCPCPRCRRQDTLQREVDIFSVQLTFTQLDKLPDSSVVVRATGLEVKCTLPLHYDDVHWDTHHIGLYPWEWLLKYSSRSFYKAQGLGLETIVGPVLWTADQIKENPPSVQYDEVMASDAGVGRWTQKIREFGFCFVDGVPVCPHKTQELLERISFVRPTHYGGFYDFTSDLTMKDTAYTSEAIGPHTDTTYFTDPAGLQMFHLLSHEDGVGGESLLVDGFKAAQELDIRDRENLYTYNISWHASGNDGITIHPSRNFPVLTQTGPANLPLQIRWNNADRRTVNPRIFEKWAGSAKAFSDIVNDPKMQYWEQLQPGRALSEWSKAAGFLFMETSNADALIVFDNWRILHGRSAFTGKRRICGGYINHDDFWSRFLNTNYTRDEVIQHIL
ncbi:trimethyllysine dioxygenase protein [Rutstroemia sp. NJR-2017a BVV2]|nr:trimethyllysine dioxygenase protein [Rutstroemia sp. NJR-2017a BVV2]PQE18584.1 trimethyllysine dioxygenase protein [Rutstroemia sp. NJR-2017a BVV2]